MHVCVRVCMCTRVQVPLEAPNLGSPWSWNYRLLWAVWPGCWETIQVLCKNNMCSKPLSHLSSLHREFLMQGDCFVWCHYGDHLACYTLVQTHRTECTIKVNPSLCCGLCNADSDKCMQASQLKHVCHSGGGSWHGGGVHRGKGQIQTLCVLCSIFLWT